MLKKGYIGLLVLVFYTTWPALAQIRQNAFTIADDQMVLYLDLKLKKTDIDSLLRIADIKGVTVDNLLHGNFNQLQKEGWTISHMADNRLMLMKPLNELAANAQMKPFLITSNMVLHNKQPGYPDNDVKYGVNNFLRQNVHELPSGVTRFFLPANLKAKRVLLSGNFNSWSTSKGIMIKTDSGWIYDIKLDAGEYLYKFVVNGRWINDGGNLLKEDDGFDDHNSVYFKYNYTFKLKSFPKAARVMLAGSFNGWNPNQIVMMPAGAGVWVRTMYLHEGSHTYRFLVDGKWTKDPANPNTQTDAAGNVNSVLNIGEPLVFKLNGFANAKNVIVAGSFNKWRTDELHLYRSGSQWILPYALPAGNYEYKFIVDGRWMTDPDNPNYCEYNGETNSFLAVKPNHTFILKGYEKAKNVRLSGTFNDWNEPGWSMAHKGDWTISVCLAPGKALYKFIIDGNWIIDPGNNLWEQNQFHTGNSVLWMER